MSWMNWSSLHALPPQGRVTAGVAFDSPFSFLIALPTLYAIDVVAVATISLL